MLPSASSARRQLEASNTVEDWLPLSLSNSAFDISRFAPHSSHPSTLQIFVGAAAPASNNPTMAATRSLSFHLRSSNSAPAARAFLQIASRRPLLVLDFLAPAAASQHATPTTPLYSLPRSASRLFSTSPTRKQTIAIRNPRQDEYGKEMSVEITPRASSVSYKKPAFPCTSELRPRY